MPISCLLTFVHTHTQFQVRQDSIVRPCFKTTLMFSFESQHSGLEAHVCDLAPAEA